MAANEIVVRATADERVARDWGLVLGSAGIGVRVERRDDAWAVVVGADDGARAAAALAAYDSETIPPPPAPEPVEWGPTRAGLVVAALLIAMRPLAGYKTSPRPLFDAGDGRAGAILQGQVWRAVTSLTLHADAVHLLGNVLGAAVFVTAVSRLLGPGLGCWLILLAGAGGNLMTAFLEGPLHQSVGASTAIFGAIGILAGLAIVRTRAVTRRPWVPLAAGLALLALLGTGERADLVAHLFGFQLGIALGISAALIDDDLPSPRAQRVLAATAFLAVVGCWALAHQYPTVVFKPPPKAPKR
jgi:membrane associated rhomboid family serine protease